MDGIAIIGLAGRFPGARSVAEFWRNLRNGVESISHFTAEDLEVRDAAALSQNPNYVRARSILEDVDLFDAGFFGIYPQEAKFIDPQHRVFLECCWEAIEDSGDDAASNDALTGVFAGCSPNSYFLRQIAGSRAYIDDFTSAYQVGFYPAMLGTIADTLATRVAYKLNLKGPAMTVLAACSTSLVAVCEAYKSLMAFECDQALAGAVSITFPQKRGYLHQSGGMVSPDGHCRAFDADAQGTVFGSGAGVVYLKRLEDAIRDRNHIYGVIRGAAINNDGSQKVGFTAPSVEGQARVIAMAQAIAGVEARSISYIEAHGTGTPLGDPIELAALTRAFRGSTSDTGFCAIGTAKANVGHLDVAAGVTGLIKTALAIKHREFPPQINFNKPNPKLELETSPFFVNTKLSSWRPVNGEPLRAGVSAFGVGGTNAHVVLEEAPAIESIPSTRPYQVLSFSAKSPEALEAASDRLAEHLTSHLDVDLADVAYTLHTGRQHFEYRRSITASSAGDAVAALGAKRGSAAEARQTDPKVHFLFPGQGSQHLGMGQELYQSEPVFRKALDGATEILRPDLGLDLRDVIYPSRAAENAGDQLTATGLAQPAIFCVEYALAQLWMSWGVRPAGMLGHSIGEFVAACLAGVFSLEDALKLVAARGRLMQDLPGGAMLSVRLPESEVAELLNGGLSIAAMNGPKLTVVSGSFDHVASLEKKLEAHGVLMRRLHTSHAFHSAMMDPIVQPFTECIRSIQLHAPTLPYLSCVTGTWVTSEQATDPGYWATHFRQPVRFSQAVVALRSDAGNVLLEVGPGTTLQTLARQHAAAESSNQVVLSSWPDSGSQQSAAAATYETLGRLWSAGVPVDWQAFYGREQRRRVSLPAYPFERKRYWAEPDMADASENAEAIPSALTHAIPEIETTGEPISMHATPVDRSRKDRIVSKLTGIFEELSGMEAAEIHADATFLELGFDSLFLTQVSQSLQSNFSVKITFRQLLDELSSIHALAAYLDQQLPAEQMAEPVKAAANVASTAPVSDGGKTSGVPASGIEQVMQEQLRAMTDLVNRQLEILRGGAANGPVAAPAPTGPKVDAPKSDAPKSDAPRVEADFKAFGPYKPVQKGATGGLTPRQDACLNGLIERYTKRTAASKSETQKYRKVLADPRVASGFRLQWKEMVYPIVTNRSRGSRLWDIDGNEYIDLLNGFGPTAFGHLPEFVTQAISKQLSEGIEIGPQSPLAGEVAQLICDLTGVERVTFCNTGSEAVMAAIRVARTVTARKKIALFAGSYHGTFDEVLVKRIGKLEALRSGPIAPGIPAEKVQNVMVLDYGSPESLELIRKHAGELAAVLVEPVQSRHPALQPREFLKEIRKITEASGTALIIDEIVTGFRTHPGGIQALFDIRADLVTYGKVLGGGMPIGVLAGKSAFMDALDGGMWQYGDDSFPEVGVTFFAGTFVRHPLALAAAKAVLEHLKSSGPELQLRLAERAAQLVARLNGLFEANHVPSKIETFGSVFYFSFPADFRFGSILYYMLRERGIHIQEGFPCFLTTAHTDEDIETVYKAFEDSVREMREGELLPEGAATAGAIEEAPLTEAQLEIWLSAQLSTEASCSYNEAFTVDLRGALNEPALRKSIQAVIDRHDALRASFDSEGKTVHFVSKLNIEIPLIDLTGAQNAAEALEKLIEQDARTPFDLNAGPLVRVRIVKMAQNQHTVLFTSHHIVCDGWSTNVLLDEIARLYSAQCRGTEATLDPVLAFSAYARRQHTERDSGKRAEVESYWLNQFKDRPPVLELPADRPRPAVKAFAGGTARRKIGRELYQNLKKAGAKRGCTLFATMLTGFEALLCRLTGQDDVVVGIPAAAQSLEEGHALVGHCVNFLPLRARLSEGETFAQFLAQGKRTLLDAYDQQTYTYGTLIRNLGIKRDPSRLPLVEVQFNLERVGTGLKFDGLEVKTDSCAKQYANFDLFLNVVESEDGLVMDCDYNSDLFDRSTVDRWLGHYEMLLHSAAENMDRPVGLLALLSEAELDELLNGRNNTDAVFPNCTVHELFEQQAASTPGAIAVVFGRQTITYSELNARANELASFLQSQDAGANHLVGICMDRSAQMVIAMLAVLKAGGAYVPLDPAYPKERLDFILGETDVKILLTEERVAIELGSLKARAICLDTQWAMIAGKRASPAPARATADQLAYVIYTSGSTGQPKGVEIQHRAVVNFLTSMRREPGLEASDRLLAVTTLSFDISGLEILLPLITGARVVIADRDSTMDGQRLADLIREAGINVMQATPSTWRLLLEAEWKPKPGFKMLCGGEALPRDLADQLLNTEGVLWNMYGPTETTIWSAVSHVNPGPAPVQLGAPIANTQFYVLDRYHQPVPPGVPGELLIGGAGVARGYFLRPELTREKFLPDSFRKGSDRLYRTGDLVRTIPGGRLEFLGRLDNQVKIRGFRIELGEIDAMLMKQPEVKEAVVIAHGEGAEKKLVAYVVGHAEQELDARRLKAALSAVLPAYMVPSAFVALTSIPRTPNGKLDRRALPAPTLSSAPRMLKPPRNQAEEALSGIFSEVLRLDKVSIDDNLFELGADSIQVFQIVARANRAGLGVTVQQVLRNPTVETLSSARTPAESIENAAQSQPIRAVPRDRYRVKKG